DVAASVGCSVGELSAQRRTRPRKGRKQEPELSIVRLVIASIPIWQVRFNLALPAASRICAWVLSSQQAHSLHHRIETVSGTAVVVPVTRWRPIHSAVASNRAADGMNCQIEMTP